MLTDEFYKLEYLSKKYRDVLLSNLNLHSNDIKLLIPILDHPGVQQKVIVDTGWYKKDIAKRKLDLYEKNGLIRREPSKEDRRYLLVFPTEKLKELEPNLKFVIRHWYSFITEELTEEEKTQLEMILKKMNARGEKYDFAGEDL